MPVSCVSYVCLVCPSAFLACPPFIQSLSQSVRLCLPICRLCVCPPAVSDHVRLTASLSVSLSLRLGLSLALALSLSLSLSICLSLSLCLSPFSHQQQAITVAPLLVPDVKYSQDCCQCAKRGVGRDAAVAGFASPLPLPMARTRVQQHYRQYGYVQYAAVQYAAVFTRLSAPPTHSLSPNRLSLQPLPDSVY
jgi:hypothetical protein